MSAAGEFDIIARYFKPLATDRGALGLSDDGALFDLPAGHEAVVTTDAMVSGIHFFANDRPDTIGWKLLAVNLSDLAAMGATPLGYTLALGLPADWNSDWLGAFSLGLKTCQERYGTSLLGGDTVRSGGVFWAAITAFGAVPKGSALRRNGARTGDAIWVSGTVGDAALAVQLRNGWTPPAAVERAGLDHRLDLPEPRLALGQALRGIATAALDISDGLAADLGHICETSEVGAIVQLADVPLSPTGRGLLARDPDVAVTVLTGGDDYELLFTSPADADEQVYRAAEAAGTPVARIGRITPGFGVRIVDGQGHDLNLPHLGFTHF